MTDDDGGGNLYENHSKLCLIYNQKSRCVEKKSLDISQTQTRTRIYDLIEKSHQSDKNISESLLDTIKCDYTIVPCIYLFTVDVNILNTSLYTVVCILRLVNLLIAI